MLGISATGGCSRGDTRAAPAKEGFFGKSKDMQTHVLALFFAILTPDSHEKPLKSAFHGKSVLLHKAEG